MYVAVFVVVSDACVSGFNFVKVHAFVNVNISLCNFAPGFKSVWKASVLQLAIYGSGVVFRCKGFTFGANYTKPNIISV